jgi:hypothetical protein
MKNTAARSSPTPAIVPTAILAMAPPPRGTDAELCVGVTVADVDVAAAVGLDKELPLGDEMADFTTVAVTARVVGDGATMLVPISQVVAGTPALETKVMSLAL